MRLTLVSIWDKRMEEYSPPMCQHTLGTAERMFGDMCNDPNSPMNKHPEDYELHHLGTFDTEHGSFETKEPERLLSAQQVITTKQ